jgi:hypothetical protein
MGCRQCLPFGVVQLKGKHCRKPHCRNGVVDTFRPCLLILFSIKVTKQDSMKILWNKYIKIGLADLTIALYEIKHMIASKDSKHW